MLYPTKDLLKLVLIIQFGTLVAVFLNVPLLRQVFGFIYLSFVPGALILDILKANPKSKLSFTLLSVGLSIAFVMFVGVFVNGLFPLLGILTPLSTLPLTVTIGIISLTMSFAAFKRDAAEEGSVSSSPITVRQVLGILPLFSIPFLAVFGAMYSDSLLLLVMILSIAVLVVVSLSRIIPTELKPFAILAIALSVLFQIPFLSQHLIGFDVFEEFHVFRLAQANSLWNPALVSPMGELTIYNGMLSVTVLPTVYSNLLNISGEWVFRLLYPLFYSLVPLTMYQMYKQPFGKPVAFLAAFYFILFPRFYAEERRQIMGELILVLLVFLMLNTSISTRKKRFLSIVFGAALVVSHYSILYIFLFCALFAWVMTSIMGNLRPSKAEMGPKALFTSRFLLVVFVLGIFWYTYVTPNLGSSFSESASRILSSITSGFTSLEARGSGVSDFAAPDLGGMSLSSQMDVIINKVPYFLVIVGFVAMVRKFKSMSLGSEYLHMLSANILILAMCFVLPAFAPAFLPQRFYHISLLFLAPICVFGGVTLLELVLKPFKGMRKKGSLILCTLYIFFILIFLFKVGFVSEITNDVPVNISVSFTRMQASNNPAVLATLYNAYSPEEDIRSVVWLSEFKGNNQDVYADDIAKKHVVVAYGMIVVDWYHTLRNDTAISSNSYVYLRYYNLKGLITYRGAIINSTEVLNQLNSTNQIYSNAKSAIHYSLIGPP